MPEVPGVSLWHHKGVPITFLAHQAPAFALKRRWPQLDGVALVVGSSVPDMAQATSNSTARYLFGRPMWWDGHTIPQQFYWCLPVGLLLTFVGRRLLAPRLGPYLPTIGDFHLQDVAVVARNHHRWWVISGSVLLGSFSHILIDQFTHSDSGLAKALPILQVNVARIGSSGVELALALQVVLSLLLMGLAVVQLHRIGRERLLYVWAGLELEVGSQPRRSIAAVWAGVLTATLLAAVFASTQIERGVTVTVMTWYWLVWAIAVVAALLVGRPRASERPSGSDFTATV